MALAGLWWHARRDHLNAFSHGDTQEEAVWVPAPRRMVRRIVRRRDAVSLQLTLDWQLASCRWLLARKSVPTSLSLGAVQCSNETVGTSQVHLNCSRVALVFQLIAVGWHRVDAAVPHRRRLRWDAAAAAEEEWQGGTAAASRSTNGVKSLAVLTKIAVGAGVLLGVALALDAYALIILS